MKSTRHILLGLLGALGAVVLWHVAALTGRFGDALPHPIATMRELFLYVQASGFWESLWATILMAGRGLAYAIIVGVIIGILVGTSPVLTHAFRVPTEFLKPIPPIVILPLAILVAGPTQAMGEFLVFYGCVLPIMYQTANGVKETDPVAYETARSYGLGRTEILLRVVLPSASAFIGTAVRVAMPVSLVVAVVAGLLGGGPGLGRDIFLAQSASNYAGLFALVAVLGALGLLIQFASKVLERRFLHWHSSYREEAK